MWMGQSSKSINSTKKKIYIYIAVIHKRLYQTCKSHSHKPQCNHVSTCTRLELALKRKTMWRQQFVLFFQWSSLYSCHTENWRMRTSQSFTHCQSKQLCGLLCGSHTTAVMFRPSSDILLVLHLTRCRAEVEEGLDLLPTSTLALQ